MTHQKWVRGQPMVAQLNIRVPEHMLERMDRYVDGTVYRNRSDVVRAALEAFFGDQRTGDLRQKTVTAHATSGAEA